MKALSLDEIIIFDILTWIKRYRGVNVELKWMGDYRLVIEKLIKYCNFYIANYNKEAYRGTDIPFSFAQIQIVEYLLENEDLHQNMSTISSRLGITTSYFSKLVNKLVKKGLLEKFHIEGNRKNIIIQVTETGKRVYGEYSEFIYKTHFSKMFQAADKLPRECLPIIAEMLDAGLVDLQLEEKKESVLIPVEGKD